MGHGGRWLVEQSDGQDGEVLGDMGRVGAGGSGRFRSTFGWSETGVVITSGDPSMLSREVSPIRCRRFWRMWWIIGTAAGVVAVGSGVGGGLVCGDFGVGSLK